MVYVLDKYGNELSTTTRNGKVRKLLKEKKARVVKDNPFTIQLLYDNSDELFDTELKNPEITVISNANRVPDVSEFNGKIVFNYTFDEVINSNNTDGILVRDVLLVDVDGLSYDVYNALREYEEITIIKYFRFNNTPFIKSKIYELNTITAENLRQSIEFQYSTNFETLPGSTLVYGGPATGKTTFLKNLGNQCARKGASVDFISVIDEKDNNGLINYQKMNAAKFATYISDMQKEMMRRFRLMESSRVNSYFRIDNNYDIHSNVIIIDGFSTLIKSANANEKETIAQALGSLLRLCRAAGIVLVISSQEFNPKILSKDCMNNMVNNVVFGNINKEMSNYIFDEISPITSLPIGTGLIKSGNDYQVFSIEEVAKL